MPKDNENISLPDFGPLTPSEAPGFAPDEMLQCEKCGRANPPTRASCIYCGTAFAYKEETASVRRPSLRPLEVWEQGYSNIVFPASSEPAAAAITSAADFLRFEPADLERIFASEFPVPVALTASAEEAQLIGRRLQDLGFETMAVSDSDLGITERHIDRVRAIHSDERELSLVLGVGDKEVNLQWSDVSLLVRGRLTRKNVAVKERKLGGRDSEILDATETYSDDEVLDVYTRKSIEGFRINAGGFDFSCLGSRKGLLARDNFTQLIEFFGEKSKEHVLDDSYRRVRQMLELVWPSEKQTESRGWRRERIGKVTVDAIAASNNEHQFTRYSALRNYLQRRSVST